MKYEENFVRFGYFARLRARFERLRKKRGLPYLRFGTDIYSYSNDGLEINIYLSEKETPYFADGIKGNVSVLTEIFVKLPKTEEQVSVSVGAISGQMNYRAVENDYYLSVSDGSIQGESAEVTLTCDGV